MGCATMDFTDLGGLAASSLVNVSGFGNQRLHVEPQISPDYCFEGIVGKSAALQKVLEQVAIVAPTDSTVLLHGLQRVCKFRTALTAHFVGFAL